MVLYKLLQASLLLLFAIKLSEAQDTECNTADFGNQTSSNCSSSSAVQNEIGCTLNCLAGYWFTDESIRFVTCQNGSWNADFTGICDPVTCHGPPNLVNNGDIGSGCNNGSQFETSCNITCDHGYYKAGTGLYVCNDTSDTSDSNQIGFWDNGGTSCTAITCAGTPNLIEDGKIGSGCNSESQFETSCSITCDDGYYKTGTGLYACNDTSETSDSNQKGFWDNGGTSCTAITCDGTPNSIGNGKIGSGCDSGSQFETSCSITCDDGYYKTGTGLYVCNDTSEMSDSNEKGFWDNGGTSCTAITCDGTPNSIGNGKIGSGCNSGSQFETSCSITCDDGYYKTGTGLYVCNDTSEMSDSNEKGFWDNGGTSCTAITCDGTPNSIGNGKIGSGCNSGSQFETSCSITCDDGYYKTGTGLYVCNDTSEMSDSNEKGFWDNGGTSCTAVTCNGNPNTIDNGNIEPGCESGSLFGTSCNISCDPGYYKSGTGVAVCNDSSTTTDLNEIGFWDNGGTLCSAYMVLNVPAWTSAVKYKNVTLTVSVTSSASSDVTITVVLVQSPQSKYDGTVLELYSNNSGVLTYATAITNLSESDQGNYTFQSTALSFSDTYENITTSGTMSLSVFVIPENIEFSVNGNKESSNYTYIRGSSNDTMTCSADGKPTPNFDWQSIDANATGNVLSNGEKLNLGKSYFSDNGTYTCNVTNNVSMEYQEYPSSSIYIDIEGVPVLTGTSSFTPFQENITFTCSIDANPKPNSVTWRTGEMDYNFTTDAFATEPKIDEYVNGSYYQYQSDLTLASQLCIGRQNIDCSSSNTHGQSVERTEFLLNNGSYDLYQTYYFYYSEQNFTFEMAQEECSNSSGHLMYIPDNETQQYLSDRITSGEQYYIGAVRDGSGWTWGLNGEPLQYENFINGSSGNCTVASESGWLAVDCSESYPYICQVAASGFPKNLDITKKQCNGTVLNVKWDAADSNFAETQHRMVIKSTNTTDILTEVTGLSNTYSFTNATADTEYMVEIYAAVDVCLPKYTPTVTMKATTGFGIPKEVSDASMKNSAGNDICEIQWSYNTTFQWQIENYKVTISTKNGQTEVIEESNVKCNPGSETSCTFEMDPNSEYTANIVAVSTCGIEGEPVAVGETDEQGCKSEVSAPSEPKLDSSSNPTTTTIDASTGIFVRIPAQDQRNGSISCVFVIVTDDKEREQSNGRTPSTSPYNLQGGEHIAYAYDNASLTVSFSIGVNQQNTGCDPVPTSRRKKRQTQTNSLPAYNKELDPNRYYRYYIIITTPTMNTTMPLLFASSAISVIWETNYYAWVAAIVVPFVLLVAGGVFYYFWRKRRGKTNKSQGSNAPIGNPNPAYYDDDVYEEVPDDIVAPPPKRINSRDLENVYLYNHKDDDRQFRDEYKQLKELSKKLDHQFSEAKEIRGLNRFVNVLPSNDATVKISSSRDNAKGYINASYIDGYNQRRKFIATQGPKVNTVNDFWKMICEHRIEAIVMLTNVDENGKRKCEKYWPDESETTTYGNITVSCITVSALGPIMRRKFNVTEGANGTTREVFQYHYIAWPDHGVPLTTSDLFNLRRIVKMEHERKKCPIVVHCSAGVGRTGTFIALDHLMDELSARNSVDITSQIWSMRQNRTEMVQTADQYVLLHKMILELYLLKQTDTDVPRIEEKIERIRLRDEELEVEFNLVGKVGPLEVDQEIGSSTQHMQFNRDPNIIPYDHNIVNMRMRPDERTAPYFNASLIQGYELEDRFIASQDPIEGSEELFWRMVLDNDVNCIVLIRQPGEAQDICAKYWPYEQSVECGKVTLSLLDTYTERNFTQRDIFVKEVVLTTVRSCTVHQFEFNAWPTNPSAGATPILDLISRVQREKRTPDARTGPVLVHCGNGSELVGAYCAITNILERLKVENRVDVLRTVKDLRDMRPGMVGNLDEYRLCYAAIQTYLSSFDLYSNYR